MPGAEFRYCLDHVLFLHLERSEVDGKGKEKFNLCKSLLFCFFCLQNVIILYVKN
jgi:hypothetical protein